MQSSSAVHLGLTTCVWFVMLGDFLMVVLVSLLLSLSMMVTCFCLVIGCFIFVVGIRFGSLKLMVMLTRVWFLTVVFGKLTGWVMMLLVRLLTLGARGLIVRLLMLAATLLEFVADGTQFVLTLHRFFLLPLLGLWSIMVMVLRPDPVRFVLLVLFLRRRVVHAVRDHAILPGPAGMWGRER